MGGVEILTFNEKIKAYDKILEKGWAYPTASEVRQWILDQKTEQLLYTEQKHLFQQRRLGQSYGTRLVQKLVYLVRHLFHLLFSAKRDIAQRKRNL